MIKPIVLVLSILALIVSILWVYETGFEKEPIITFLLGLVGMISLFIKSKPLFPKNQLQTSLSNISEPKQNVNVEVNIDTRRQKGKKEEGNLSVDISKRDSVIEMMKPKLHILFIDDDKNFNVVKILKDSGWRNTKSVVDIKGIDLPLVKETDIFFVDINGVGKLLHCEYEGLDLALMLKQKYPNKKVVIYSANKNSNSFHQAWDVCDYKLEKNALPYQFQNLVEEYSTHFAN